MEATLDPYIAHKLKRVINDEMSKAGSKSKHGMTEKDYASLIFNEQRKTSNKYLEEEANMKELVKAVLKPSENVEEGENPKGPSLNGPASNSFKRENGETSNVTSLSLKEPASFENGEEGKKPNGEEGKKPKGTSMNNPVSSRPVQKSKKPPPPRGLFFGSQKPTKSGFGPGGVWRATGGSLKKTKKRYKK